MMKNKFISISLISLFIFIWPAYSKVRLIINTPGIRKGDIKQEILQEFKTKHKGNKSIQKLQKKILRLGKKGIPILIKVMKEGWNFPDKNRWIATIMLAKMVGKKAAPFISKFAEHPDWFMRMASLKALLLLKQKKYYNIYAQSLKDASLLVRFQALQNIKQLKIKKSAPFVWAMLYDRKNYSGKKGKRKRLHIIKSVIQTIGDLNFTKAKFPLMKMAQRKKYRDIFNDIDQTLVKITGKRSPSGNRQIKRRHWKHYLLQKTVIK